MASPCVSGPISRATILATPLEQRIHLAPPAVTALALRRNLGNGVTIKPRPAAADHPLIPTLRRMLTRLPDALRSLAQGHIAAIYLVQGNFGSARVEAAHDLQGRLIGGCVLLNLDALAQTANAWASWRESSAFQADDRYQIQITLEPPQTDDAEHTLRFVFLHELGHILGMAVGVHGFWADPETWPATARSPYTRFSWNTNGSELTSLGKRRYPVLTLPRFYRFENAPLPRSAAPLVYSALSATNWPSLYGSIDPYEDFAETFVLYLHTRMLGSPFQVDVYAGRRHVGEYRSCLDTGRCPEKLTFIERLLIGGWHSQ